MDTNIQVTSDEYNLKIDGNLSFCVSGNTIRITHESTNFETVMKGPGKVIIEWSLPKGVVEQQPRHSEEPFSVPSWDSERQILVDLDRFLYNLRGEIYGKIAQHGGGIRPLNDAERTILAIKKIPIREEITTCASVKRNRAATREEKSLLDKTEYINAFKNAFISDDTSIESDDESICPDHEEIQYDCNKC